MSVHSSVIYYMFRPILITIRSILQHTEKDSVLHLSYLNFYKQKESFENSIENLVKKINL